MRLLGAIAVVVAGLVYAAPAQAGCNGNTAWQDRFPSWSPRGDAIAFMRQLPGCDPPPEAIGVVRLTAQELTFAADGTRRSLAPPTWDPGGLALAYSTESQTVAVDGIDGPVGNDGLGLFPSWAGASIAVTVGTSLQLIELITGVRRVLVPSYVKPSLSNGVAVWSPDRRRLAFGVTLDNAEGGIGVVEADGSSFRVIARGPNQSVNPTWSPDGRTIAFETNRDGNFEIYSADVDGAGALNLTNSPSEDRLPAWHGSQIAFISNRNRMASDTFGYAVFTMSTDGNVVLFRAADAHPYSGLAWSPDGARIAFASGRECQRWGVYVVQLSDDSVRRLTNQCHFNGTRNDDRLTGTPFLDFLDGGGGKDQIWGLAGPDVLRGDLGADHLYGGPGPDQLIGGRGDDVIAGGEGDDRVVTEDRGRDRVFGGGGDDQIRSDTGSRDVIACGSGRDTVDADRIDVVGRDCERVRRR